MKKKSIKLSVQELLIRIKLILAILLSLASMQVFADQAQCVSFYDAKEALNSYLLPMEGQVPFEDFRWLDEDAILTGQMIRKAVASLEWKPLSRYYETSLIFDGYCAAGASCWGWYRVDCSGSVSPIESGED